MKRPVEPLYSQSYIDAGQGHPVILLHGPFGELAMWRHTINSLQKNYRVLVPRLPLFDVPIHRANLDNLVEILEEYLDWHELRTVTLIGTDIGAQLALCYADKFPSRVRNVVLSGAVGILPAPVLADVSQPANFKSISTQVKAAFFTQELATEKLVHKVYKTLASSPGGLHVRVLDESSRKTDMFKVLNNISLPVLIVWGLQDKITPPEAALHIHDLLPNGTVKFINECGHLPMIEKPNVYASHIHEFLRL